VLVPCDPKEDRSWLQSSPVVYTDNCHRLAGTGGRLGRCWPRLIIMQHCILNEVRVPRCCIAQFIKPSGGNVWLASLTSASWGRCTATDPPWPPPPPGPNLDTPENWSEAVKRLKQRYLQRVIDAFAMDQCLIFCRTNFDCDNLEKFLNGLGGSGLDWSALVSPPCMLIWLHAFQMTSCACQ
jgi:hypothetical protein